MSEIDFHGLFFCCKHQPHMWLSWSCGCSSSGGSTAPPDTMRGRSKFWASVQVKQPESVPAAVWTGWHPPGEARTDPSLGAWLGAAQELHNGHPFPLVPPALRLWKCTEFWGLFGAWENIETIVLKFTFNDSKSILSNPTKEEIFPFGFITQPASEARCLKYKSIKGWHLLA